MAERTDELREDIDYRRDRIGDTVDQIGNRVNPRHVAARTSYRMRTRLIDMKDRIMGNDQPDYPWQSRYGTASGTYGYERGESAMDRVSNMADRATDRISEVGDTISEVPGMVRQQTRGNPMAAGLIAFGAGVLMAGALPPTQTEQQALHRAEPALDQVREEVKEKGQQIAGDMKDSARESAEQVKEQAQESAHHLQEETKDAVKRTQGETG
jgi:gas vesicle protein